MQLSQRENKRTYFKEVTKEGIMTNKQFWTTIRPFLAKKGNNSTDFITFAKDAELISNEKELKEIIQVFNENYVIIVEISSEEKTTSIGNNDNPPSSEVNLNEIVKSYSSHPSMLRIKKSITTESFDFQKANVEKINKIIRPLDTNKATGPKRYSRQNCKTFCKCNRQPFMKYYQQ